MDAAAYNAQLVDRLIAEGALWSPPVIAAFRDTPRHRFLERVFRYVRKTNRWQEIITREPAEDELRLLYSDRALITGLQRFGSVGVPISSSSQPSLMAQMLQDLQLQPGQRVLEIGAGTGYNAALLAHVVGPSRVITVDVDREVLSQAWDHLRAFPDRRVRLEHADGRNGFTAAAPYHRIMVTAATPDLEPAWLEQLAPDGLLLAPLALAPGLEYLVRGSVRGGTFEGGLVRAAYFMPLRAEGESGAESPEPKASAGAGETVAAPWAGWFDRRSNRGGWLGVGQSLAFLGWLHGLSVRQRVDENRQFVYGLSRDDAGCWLGSRDWRASGAAGLDLAERLWRQFLELGGPRPTEYALEAGAAVRGDVDGRRSFFREGARLRQRWEVISQRERNAWL